MKSLFRRVFLIGPLIIGSSAVATEWVGAERRISQVPHSETEIRAAHEKAVDFAAVVVADGKPLETREGSEAVVCRTDGGEVRVPCLRRSALAMGSDVSEADKKQLPFLTGGMILDQVNRYFLSVQVRVASNQAEIAYLLDRPLVAIARFADAQRTQPSTEIVDRSVRDIRSLGLWQNGVAESADPPRTLVLAIKSTFVIVLSSGDEQMKPHYELLFVHARPEATGRGLTLHSFGTTRHRTRLHRFAPVGQPSRLNECAIQGTIFFTEYSFGGQYPLTKATRNVRLNARDEVDLAQLDDWVRDRDLPGNAWDHLPTVLDAMIDGQTPTTPGR